MLALPAAKEQTHGLVKKTSQGEDLQTQTPQADEGESPQETFTLQGVSHI
jgi:hypothetical protein